MRRNLDLLAERRVRLPRSEALTELRADIVRAAYVEGDFELADGLRSNYYFDKYLFETRPAILRRLSRFLALGTAVSLELGLPLVIVRLDREPGASRTIEGELYADEEVALIEDVVVTGSRALRAISRVSDAGARVRQVVSVLDRHEGAAERFSEVSVGYRHLFTPGELGID
jgi:orotate phosphoribosyltransferase